MGHVPLLFTTMLWVVIILLLLLLFRLLDVIVGGLLLVWDSAECGSVIRITVIFLPQQTSLFLLLSVSLSSCLSVCLCLPLSLSRCLSVSLSPLPPPPLFLSLFLRPSLSLSGGGLGVIANSCGAKTCMKWNTSRLWRNIPLHYLPFPSWSYFAFKIIYHFLPDFCLWEFRSFFVCFLSPSLEH